MRALVLNGARDGERTLAILQAAVADELFAAGYAIDCWPLREIRIQPCEGDFGCWTKTPGVCVQRDVSRVIVEQFVSSDLTVWLTPVTFGGFSAQLTKAVDRLGCPLVWPSLAKLHGQHHNRPRYAAYPKLLVLGVDEERDVESERLFAALVERNALTLYLPAHAVGVFTPDQGGSELRSGTRWLLRKLGVG